MRKNAMWSSELGVIRDLPELARALGPDCYLEIMSLMRDHEATSMDEWAEIFPPLAQIMGPSYHDDLMNSLKNLIRYSTFDVKNKAIKALPQLVAILGPNYHADFIEIIRERIIAPGWLTQKYAAETLIEMAPLLGPSYHVEIAQLIREGLLNDDYIIRRNVAYLLPKVDFIFKSLSLEELEEIAGNPHLHEVAKKFLDGMISGKKLKKNIEEILVHGKAELPSPDDERVGHESAQKRYGGLL